MNFWLSSIVNEAIKTISSQFIYFTKRLWAHKKHQSAKQTTFFLLEVFICKKLLPLLFFVCLFLFCWLVLAWFAFLRAQNLFIKKINWLEIVFMASFTILLSNNGNINEKVLNKSMSESGKCIVFFNIAISFNNN